jgi:hypothetical protein
VRTRAHGRDDAIELERSKDCGCIGETEILLPSSVRAVNRLAALQDG